MHWGSIGGGTSAEARGGTSLRSSSSVGATSTQAQAGGVWGDPAVGVKVSSNGGQDEGGAIGTGKEAAWGGRGVKEVRVGLEEVGGWFSSEGNSWKEKSSRKLELSSVIRPITITI